MFINNFIYFHIGVCILIIAFEIGWAQYTKIRKKTIERNTRKYKKQIQTQIDYIKTYGKVDSKHCEMLMMELTKVNNLIAFENAYNKTLEEQKKYSQIYIQDLLYTFVYLANNYSKKHNEAEKAYFAYIIGNYLGQIHNEEALAALIEVLYKFLECKSIYCRINAMNAICNIGFTKHILRAITIVDKSKYPHNQVLSSGLAQVKNNKEILGKKLFEMFEDYNKNTQISIIKFLSNCQCINESEILEKLKDKNTAIDVKCEIMRYFQKNKNQEVKQYLINQLNKEKLVANDLNIKAIGTLGYYVEDDVRNLLYKLKESSDDIIKENVHRSLEKMQKLEKELLLEVI